MNVVAAPQDASIRPATPAPSDRWLRLQPWALPGFLALVVGLFLLATPTWGRSGAVGLWESPVLTDDLLLGAGLVLPLLDLCVVAGVLVARRSPVLATALTALPFVTVVVTGAFVWGWWLGVLCVAVVAAVDGWPRAVLPGLVAIVLAGLYALLPIVALLPIGPVWAVSDDPRWAESVGSGTLVEVSPTTGDHVIIWALYCFWVVAVIAVAASLGAVARSRSAARAAAAATRRAAEAQAVTAERARVAHDLHDVVAHHVSLVAVRAESAPYVHPGLDDTARAVLAAIATDAREALGELRQVLAVLQRSEDAASDLAPQPGAGDVVGLVEAARAAGQDVTLTGGFDGVPPAPGYALYRAAQEALTNARRHAPGRPVVVDARVVGRDGHRTAVLRVTNPVDDGERSGTGGTGRGLAGMRERVEALGGTLSAGPDDDGATFVVEARILLVGVASPAASEPVASA
ncbi:signal transduction histidine kinase [Cellulosimicrobium cellulans]|uniref:sensor histidine kinase n=1 Tax=Cellulosimicrobium cellulans TaxID=1710 RepID=UPI001957240F|nr:histidine kinase [Cellulosimicrobium cellulans]MBM7817975.1 signal transduction histidine kinase [Cellulosimicrobium cellulans]